MKTDQISKKIITFLLIAFMCALIPTNKSYAETNGSASISISSNTVAVGENFTVTITISTPKQMNYEYMLYYDSSIVSNVSSSDDNSSDSGGAIHKLEYKNDDATQTITYTMTAIAQGTATFQLSNVEIGYLDGDFGKAPATSASVTVQNPTPSQVPTGYSDTSLSYLNTSAGELNASAGSWRLDVGNDVTTFAIDARATYGTTTVSGPFSALQPGENWFNIHVVAMDGVTARDYAICVVRAADAAVPSQTESSQSESITAESSTAETEKESSSESESETETQTSSGDKKVTLADGSVLYGVDSLAGIDLPTGFETYQLILENGSIAAAKDSRGLILVYLTDETGKNGAFYIWDEDKKVAYPYVSAEEPQNSLVFLQLPEDTSVPIGYEAIEIDVDGKKVTAYQKTGTESTIYLIYGIDENGETGWYWYDSETGSFFPYEANDADFTQEELDQALAQKDQELFRYKILMMVSLVLAILFLIGFIVVQILLLKAKKRQDDLSDELDELKNEDALEETMWEDTAEEESSELLPDEPPIIPDEAEETIDLVPNPDEKSADANHTSMNVSEKKDDIDLEVIDLDNDSSRK